MDEIQLVREFRRELPEPRPEVRTAARAALLARTEPSPRPVRRRTPRWKGRKLGLAAAGVGIAAVLTALPIVLLGGSGEVQPALGQVLHQAAVVAAAQEPVAPPGPGQYLFTRSTDAYVNSSSIAPSTSPDGHPCGAGHPCESIGEWSVLVPSERETWVAPDGSTRVRSVSGKPRFLSKGQRAGWVAAGSPPLPKAGQVEDFRARGRGFLDIDTSDLPTDPSALRDLIEARKIPGVDGPPGEAETFVLIGDMLRASYLPPAFRAALYQVTAKLPGVELLGQVKDPVGRTGIGIAYTDDSRGTKSELIFDPETSALLGERNVVVGSGAKSLGLPPGTEIGSAAYLESLVVDSLNDPTMATASRSTRRGRN